MEFERVPFRVFHLLRAPLFVREQVTRQAEPRGRFKELPLQHGRLMEWPTGSHEGIRHY